MVPYDYRHKTALVTGASSGIGEAFVRQLAERGVDRLVLVARRESVLEALAGRLREERRVDVDVVSEDLASPGAAARIAYALAARGTQVDVLVNNAGFGTYGRLESEDGTRLADEVQVNCSALVGLTAALLPGMQARGHGVVINVASTAAFQPLPHQAVYGATKAFVLSFSEALWGENRSTGVRVLALCPGATETAFFDPLGPDFPPLGPRQTPEQVVAAGLRAVDHGRPTVVSGVRNAVPAHAVRLVPRRAAILLAGRTMRPRRTGRARRQSRSA